MVILIVATTIDPASINPANALLAMPGWKPGPFFQDDMKSFVNQKVRVLQHNKSIIAEDDLDKRWQEATGEVVGEVIFLSKHTAVSNRPALTVHPIGVPHLREGEPLPQGGRPGWAAPPNPRIGPWLRLLKKIALSHNLVPEFELIWDGLGLGGGDAVGNWNRESDKNKVLLGIGGGHYAPRHMDIVLKDDVWVAHLLSGYSLPMEDPSQSKVDSESKEIGGTWKEAIKAAYEATRSAFPGGEILAHLDHKSFKGWQKNAITGFLSEQNIKVGKPNDFI
ncbi:D-aminoacyl-tRNA deacylase [Citrus sinensis]|uniref:D-aminoacyl-tRNA deacylase n=2 Tax=Citrus sinensis TaxID=2711 RepID=A0ACB8LG61_CITSI|nr:D-aminoacyl-tRNA deacylase [Citrus sinensis]